MNGITQSNVTDTLSILNRIEYRLYKNRFGAWNGFVFGLGFALAVAVIAMLYELAKLMGLLTLLFAALANSARPIDEPEAAPATTRSAPYVDDVKERSGLLRDR